MRHRLCPNFLFGLGLRSTDGYERTRNRKTCVAHLSPMKTKTRYSHCLTGCCNRSSNSVSAAFTLAELLVVAAVISILATIQIAALSNGSIQGRSVICVSNLRQLTRGWLLYAEDNGGWFPPNADDGSALNMAGGVSFMDGHAEMHRWEEKSTLVTSQMDVYVKPCDHSVDWLWLSQRTSIKIC